MTLGHKHVVFSGFLKFFRQPVLLFLYRELTLSKHAKIHKTLYTSGHCIQAIKHEPCMLKKHPNVTVKLDYKIPYGLQTWSKPSGNNATFPVWASCSKACRFPAHGHRVQPCETEQVTHTTLSHPLFLTASKRGKERTKAHVPGPRTEQNPD